MSFRRRVARRAASSITVHERTCPKCGGTIRFHAKSLGDGLTSWGIEHPRPRCEDWRDPDSLPEHVQSWCTTTVNEIKPRTYVLATSVRKKG